MGNRAGAVVIWRTPVLVLALMSCFGRAASAHPMHTTMTRVTIDAPGRSIRLMIRAFADDYRAAAGGKSPIAAEAIGGEASLRYLRSAITLSDNGRPLALRFCGAKITGDVAWLCVEADAPGDRARVALRNQLLCERFGDQVNIVQVAIHGPPRSILFVKGDATRILE